MKRRSLSVTAALAISLAACSTPPQRAEFETQRTYELSYDETWSRASGWFALNSVSIISLEKESGIISAAAPALSPQELPLYASCRRNLTLVPQAGRGTYNVLVQRVDDNRTSVKVTTAFQVQFSRSSGFGSLQESCFSKGTIERGILWHVANPVN